MKHIGNSIYNKTQSSKPLAKIIKLFNCKELEEQKKKKKQPKSNYNIIMNLFVNSDIYFCSKNLSLVEDAILRKSIYSEKKLYSSLRL